MAAHAPKVWLLVVTTAQQLQVKVKLIHMLLRYLMVLSKLWRRNFVCSL